MKNVRAIAVFISFLLFAIPALPAGRRYPCLRQALSAIVFAQEQTAGSTVLESGQKVVPPGGIF